MEPISPGWKLMGGTWFIPFFLLWSLAEASKENYVVSFARDGTDIWAEHLSERSGNQAWGRIRAPWLFFSFLTPPRRSFNKDTDCEDLSGVTGRFRVSSTTLAYFGYKVIEVTAPGNLKKGDRFKFAPQWGRTRVCLPCLEKSGPHGRVVIQELCGPQWLLSKYRRWILVLFLQYLHSRWNFLEFWIVLISRDSNVQVYISVVPCINSSIIFHNFPNANTEKWINC